MSVKISYHSKLNTMIISFALTINLFNKEILCLCQPAAIETQALSDCCSLDLYAFCLSWPEASCSYGRMSETCQRSLEVGSQGAVAFAVSVGYAEEHWRMVDEWTSSPVMGQTSLRYHDNVLYTGWSRALCRCVVRGWCLQTRSRAEHHISLFVSNDSLSDQRNHLLKDITDFKNLPWFLPSERSALAQELFGPLKSDSGCQSQCLTIPQKSVSSPICCEPW